MPQINEVFALEDALKRANEVIQEWEDRYTELSRKYAQLKTEYAELDHSWQQSAWERSERD